MSDIAALPCPFCGSEPEHYTCFRDEDGHEVAGVMLRCDECGIEMERVVEEDTYAAWNRRAPLPLSKHQQETAS